MTSQVTYGAQAVVAPSLLQGYTLHRR